jgi:hypothetical protein
MPAHIALVACLKQAQKNKSREKPIKPCLLRRRRIALIYINFLLRRKAHSSPFFFLLFLQFLYIRYVFSHIYLGHGVQRSVDDINAV